MEITITRDEDHYSTQVEEQTDNQNKPDAAKPNQAELRKKQKGMGCSARPPAAGPSPGGLQARLSPLRSTLSSVAPVMSGRNLFRNFLAETDKAEAQQRLHIRLPGRTDRVLSPSKLAAQQILMR